MQRVAAGEFHEATVATATDDAITFTYAACDGRDAFDETVPRGPD
eukprot:SAG31_NODE_16494_length_707_cov_0.848684_1_plen_44_part_10